MNRSKELHCLNYGRILQSAIVPVESLHLYHFHPGASIMAWGSFGCNLRCRTCPRTRLASSRSDAPYSILSPEDIVDLLGGEGLGGGAFALSEPAVWIEHVIDAARLMRESGMVTIVRTSGHLEPWAAEDLFDNVTAAVIELKGFSHDSYRIHCDGSFDEVREACEIAQDSDAHVELTYELVQGLNDSRREIGTFCEWAVEELGDELPVHFIMPRDPIPCELDLGRTVMALAQRSGVRYAYLHGSQAVAMEDTYCPECGQLLIRRGSGVPGGVGEAGSRSSCRELIPGELSLNIDKCPKCGESIPLVLYS
jgi:pyruvate formate lyase activating enzyme